MAQLVSSPGVPTPTGAQTLQSQPELHGAGDYVCSAVIVGLIHVHRIDVYYHYYHRSSDAYFRTW